MYKHVGKRAIDLILSTIGIVVLAIPMLIIALLIKIDDPGPVFFKQKRVGLHKSNFQLLKFRSMKMSTPHDTPTHLLKNPEQYITRIGKFLRKSSLDELPQIYNIWKGEMSIIGPRPALWNQYDLIEERDKYGANDVLPGLTGWAQINGRDELEIEVKAKFDGEYVERLSFLFDVKCFLGTITSVLKSEGVLEGGTGKIFHQEIEEELVSIIMPSYNTGKYISKSIDSVLAQTYENWELIIVDDCSNDNTDVIVSEYSDIRIRYIKNTINSGAAISRNKALKEAKGRWIAFLDSDDIWMPEKLMKQIRFMEKNNYYFSYTNYEEIDENDNSINVLWTGPKKITNYIMHTFNYMGCLTVMYDRKYVGLIQIVDLKKRNDYALWIKIAKKHPAYLLNESLARYRIRNSGSIMERNSNPLKRMKYNYILWRESEGLGIIKASFWTGINLFFGTMKKVIYRRKL